MAIADPTTDLFATPQRLVPIGDGRRLNIHEFGWGSPTVVFSPGIGGRTLHWRYVQAAVARHARTVSYDRAGCGFSDPASAPQLASGHVADLRAALAAARIPPPYVLVGASAGSHDVRLFAFEHPDEVVGLVLVDPALDHQNHRPYGRRYHPFWQDQVGRMHGWLADGPPAPGSPDYEACVGRPDPHVSATMNDAVRDWLLSPATWQTLIGEYETLFTTSSDQLVARRRSLGDLPIVVLTAPRDPVPDRAAVLPPSSVELEEEAADRNQGIADLVALSSRGVHRHVPDSGHVIQYDRPDTVIESVLDVLRAARADGLLKNPT
jgi:pimeloyl-ACP methyl ester carboxylesterase